MDPRIFLALQVPIDSQACDNARSNKGGSPTVACLGVGIQMIIGSLDHKSLFGLLFGLGLTCLGVFFLKLELESIWHPASDMQICIKKMLLAKHTIDQTHQKT